MHSDVYCISCKQVVASDKAGLTFRTGFYRIYPLCLCKACGTMENKPAQAD